MTLVSGTSVFLGGLIVGLFLTWVLDDDRGPLPKAITTVALLMVLDLVYIIARTTGTVVTGEVQSTTPILVVGFLHWAAFSLGAGVSTYVAEVYRRRGHP